MADNHRDARKHKHASSADLGDHAAATHLRCNASRGSHQFRGDALNEGDKRSRWIDSGIGGIQAFDIGEDNAHIGLHQARDEGGKCVVVAKANLLNRHRVVFVDDGHDIKINQALQGVTRMQIGIALRRRVSSDKHA